MKVRPCIVCNKPFASRHTSQPTCSRKCGGVLISAQRRQWRISWPDNFWRRVEKTPTCWLWHGSTGADGYGRVRIHGQDTLVHRVSYEWMVAPIPAGQVIDHLCRVRLCVRPEHLRAVTSGENVLALGSLSPARTNADKTSCHRGHPYTPENTYRNPANGWRNCRTCMREWDRQRKRSRSRKS